MCSCLDASPPLGLPGPHLSDAVPRSSDGRAIPRPWPYHPTGSAAAAAGNDDVRKQLVSASQLLAGANITLDSSFPVGPSSVEKTQNMTLVAVCSSTMLRGKPPPAQLHSIAFWKIFDLTVMWLTVSPCRNINISYLIVLILPLRCDFFVKVKCKRI